MGEMDVNWPALWRGTFWQKAAEGALEKVNRTVEGHGLCLRGEEMRYLAQRQEETLRDTGRVEFGEGVLPKLLYHFCDSPHIPKEDFAAVLDQLMACFYHFKNETGEAVSDEELLLYMKKHFDGDCQGSVEYLSGTLLEALVAEIRFGPLREAADEGEEDEDEDGEE